MKSGHRGILIKYQDRFLKAYQEARERKGFLEGIKKKHNKLVLVFLITFFAIERRN